jgi:hypothetical protein
MIYFLVSANGELCKIGFAQDVPQRFRELTTSYPWKFYCAIEGSESNERRIHDHFKRLREDDSREHFRLESKLRDYIEWLGTRAFAVCTTDGTCPPVAELERIRGYAVAHRFPWAQRSYADDAQMILGDELVPGVRKPRTLSTRILATIRSDSDDWTTPPIYVEAARRLMGAIDLDPATNPTANQIVKAEEIYTRIEDGLASPWHGRVWLNPPYGSEKGEWIERLVREYHAGNISEAVACVNAHGTDTAWFQSLWEFPVCFTHHRPKFTGGLHDKDAAAAQPTTGTAFVYLGTKPVAEFAEHFGQFGPVVLRMFAPHTSRADFAALDPWATEAVLA